MVALLLSHAIARIVTAMMEDVVEPMFNRAFNDPDNTRPATTVLGAKLKIRHFLVALFQFIAIILIAYALSNRGSYDPAFYRIM